MSETTPVLGLPLTAAGQSQKHVTVNEALLKLDAVVQMSVLERDRNDPPGSPAEGDRYLVGSAPTGAFAGHAGDLALRDSGAWTFMAPEQGWCAYVVAENALLAFDGALWGPITPSGGITELQNLALLGLGTTADTANPLAARLNNALFTARSTPDGTGDLRFKLNKDSTTNTVSQLYQSGFSGRAETGLIGSDDFAIKVSADGAIWKQALVIDSATGIVTAPFGISGSGGGASFTVAPQGRLTLTSGTPVMSAGVSGASILYYTPAVGRFVPLFDGSSWGVSDLGGELSQALSDGTKSPAAAAANCTYDLFVWSDGGTLRCTRGPTWTSDTARGTGAGTSELERIAGIHVNKVAITNGPAAQRGTYVGTIRTNGSGTVDIAFGGSANGGSAGVCGLWNAYNRVMGSFVSRDTTDSSTYATTGVWRPYMNATGNRHSFVRGLDEDAVLAMGGGIFGGSSGFGAVSIGLDATNAMASRASSAYLNPTGAAGAWSCAYAGQPGIGWRFLQLIEYAASGSIATIGDWGTAYASQAFTAYLRY